QSLKAKKANGVKLGKPENLLNNHSKAIRRSVKTNQDKARYNQNNRCATALISMMKKEGKNYVQIAEALNKQGFKTSKGCQFYAVQVWRLYRRYLK
ncbi:serine recombinase, partial [Dysgonomonas reticulitermitis]